MNTNKPIYQWGDEIVIRNDADPKFRPGQYAVVCGITERKEAADALKFEYTVEYNDGTSLLVPEAIILHKNK